MHFSINRQMRSAIRSTNPSTSVRCGFFKKMLLTITRIGVDLFAGVFQFFALLGEHAIDTFMAAFVMGRCVYHQGAVGAAVQLNAGFISTVNSRRALCGRIRGVECADLDPCIGTNSGFDGSSAFFVGGRKACQKLYPVLALKQETASSPDVCPCCSRNRFETVLHSLHSRQKP